MSLKKKYNQYLQRVNNKHKYQRGSSGFVDSEKTKTYRAEWKLEEDYNFETLTESQAETFVKQVMKSKFWAQYESKWGGPVEVRIEWMKDMGSRRRTAGVSYGQLIKLAPGTNKYIILHEMIHSAGFRNHGLYFRLNLVKACSRFLGRDVAKDLKKNFREQGLRMNKPRPALSYEQWLEKYEKYVA